MPQIKFWGDPPGFPSNQATSQVKYCSVQYIDNCLGGVQSVVQVLTVLLSISFSYLPWRPQRPALRPVYPPVDPFGNTEYIPLPGPSSPHYALPIHNNENPHFSKTKQRFVRPIRQTKYPKSNFFKYDSSKAFYKNKKEVLRQIQFNNLPWNKLRLVWTNLIWLASSFEK